MNKKKTLLGANLILLAAAIMSGCDQQASTDQEIAQSDADASVDTVQDEQTGTVSEDVEVKVALTVDPDKCIGCRHCVRQAPDYFAMNSETGKAEVISDEDIDLEEAEDLISICHADAIKIS